jgi:ATP-binding cassette subfamily B (MDR/TAP) protein 1
VLFGVGTAAAEAAGSTAIENAKHRQITLWKKEYLKSILRQDVGWYDVNRPQELSTRMGESLVYIEKGLHSSNGNIFSNKGQVSGGWRRGGRDGRGGTDGRGGGAGRDSVSVRSLV